MGIRKGAVESMERLEEILSFFEGKKVLVTGHTGFKGSWLCLLLSRAGARVAGYSLDAPTDASLFQISGMQETIAHYSGDVRN